MQSPEKVSSVGFPVLKSDILDSDQGVSLLLVLILEGEDGEPGQDCPETVLFSDVITTRPKGFLPADVALACTHNAKLNAGVTWFNSDPEL